ncbi:hypothetical protein HPP92_008532 [Vanilla planifolia]|uniref:CCT domain-containing protein n=1 Tax=Vanilla planifolia TaxID=51239 RepID=A0A835R6A0_VANPL|nr:hypothetical protein HPP92_008532 [Vanilla planifolia]
MLQDMIRTPEQLSIDDCISSSIADQILGFEYEGDLFQEARELPEEVSSAAPTDSVAAVMVDNNSAVAATSMAAAEPVTLPCYDDDDAFTSSFSPFDSSTIFSALLDPHPQADADPESLPSPGDIAQVVAPPLFIPTSSTYANATAAAAATTTSNNAGDFASLSPNSVVSQLSLIGPACQLLQPTTLYQENRMQPLSGYLGFEPSSLRPCSFLDAGGSIGGEFYGEGMGMTPFGGDVFSGNGIYAHESLERVYSSGDLQVIGDGQNLVTRCSSSPTPLPLASEISTLDDSSYRVGRLSMEERKEKIHRYLKKRNERNFSKKIKYACRKTLADSRPRVRGRFAKNDEFSEVAPRPSSANQEYEEEEEMVVKDDQDMLQSSDILALISGVNSFKYNYTVESWI